MGHVGPLVATSSNGLQPTSNGLQPNSNRSGVLDKMEEFWGKGNLVCVKTGRVVQASTRVDQEY